MRDETQRALLIVLVSSLALGCALFNPTPYQPLNYFGGYSETRIQEGVFRVEFAGNPFTGQAQAQDYALLRSAEIALNDHYRYFVIVDNQSRVVTKIHSSSPQATTTYQQSPLGTMTAKTKYSGGEVTTVNRPVAGFIIQCFYEKPDQTETLLYDATQIKENIGSKYGVKLVTHATDKVIG